MLFARRCGGAGRSQSGRNQNPPALLPPLGRAALRAADGTPRHTPWSPGRGAPLVPANANQKNRIAADLRSCSSATASAPRGHHKLSYKPERIGHYELLPRRLGNPTTGACPCRSARTRATPAAAAPARQRASKRHAGWLSRVWAVLRGTVRRGTQPRPHTHTHAHSYQPVCIINTYYLTYPTPHTRDARLGRR